MDTKRRRSLLLTASIITSECFIVSGMILTTTLGVGIIIAGLCIGLDTFILDAVFEVVAGDDCWQK